MNAELLKSVALEVSNDLARTGVVGALNALAKNLSNQAREPQQPSHGESAGRTRAELTKALTAAPSNNFSAVTQQVAQQIGAWELTGLRLLARLNDIFRENNLTMAAAVEQLKGLVATIEQLDGSLSALVDSLSKLHIGADNLGQGEAEVSVLIPRAFVHDQLKGLAKELKELNGIFLLFTEIATGTRPPLKIRTISASDFSILLAALPQTAALIADVMKAIVVCYESLQQIRATIDVLKGAKVPVPDKALQPLMEHADELMNKGIADLVPKIAEQYLAKLDPGRRNELQIELTTTCKKLAARIDRSFNIAVRIGPPPDADDIEVDGEQSAERVQADIVRVQDAAPALRFRRDAGEPILKLPAPPTDDNGDADGDDEPDVTPGAKKKGKKPTPP